VAGFTSFRFAVVVALEGGGVSRSPTLTVSRSAVLATKLARWSGEVVTGTTNVAQRHRSRGR
jgi:hypothetical protein